MEIARELGSAGGQSALPFSTRTHLCEPRHLGRPGENLLGYDLATRNLSDLFLAAVDDYPSVVLVKRARAPRGPKGGAKKSKGARARAAARALRDREQSEARAERLVADTEAERAAAEAGAPGAGSGKEGGAGQAAEDPSGGGGGPAPTAPTLDHGPRRVSAKEQRRARREAKQQAASEMGAGV